MDPATPITGLISSGGVIGLILYMIVQELLKQLKKKNGSDPSTHSIDLKVIQIDSKLEKTREEIYKISRWAEDLHKWHDVHDSEGVKTWYTRRSLEEAVKSLAENVTVQTQILTSLVNEIKDSRRDIGGLEKEISDLHGKK